MNLLDLTPEQLKRAASIKEQIDVLNKELRSILAASPTNGAAPRKMRRMSALAKMKIAATQKARWASLRRAKPATTFVKSAAQAKKKTMGTAARAKMSAKLKAYWAAKKAGKK
jgi:hypothetical protein